jgi:hypothetical protein
MIRKMRTVAVILLAASAAALAPALVAAPEDGAAEAGKAWAAAIVARDVDAQMKLLPATMFPKTGDRERQHKMKVHDNELAVINKQKYLAFDVRAPAQTVKFGNVIAVVLPYRSVLTVAQGKLQTDSVLIALAEEGSGKWSVFDGTGQTLRSLKLHIPGYAGGLGLPAAVTKVIKDE